MDQQVSDFLAERFEKNRAHLRSVAYRMLGSMSDADDAVQETWLRLSRADTSGVENLTGWLTTVVNTTAAGRYPQPGNCSRLVVSLNTTVPGEMR